jgi:hypothetical protein
MNTAKRFLLVPFLALCAAIGGVAGAAFLDNTVEAQSTGSIGSINVVGGVRFRTGTADPTAGGGVSCTAPCKYFRTGTLEEYLKTGSGNTAWSKAAVSGGTIGALTATGRITGAGFTSSVDGDTTTPAYNFSSATNAGRYVVSGLLGDVTGGGLRWLVTSAGVSTESGGPLNVQYALGLAVPPATKTSNYTLTTADFHVPFDSTSGAITVTLPAAASSTGRVYVIRKTNASANAVTIDPNGAETIDGGATLAVANQTAKLIICNGTAWITIGTMT